MKTFYILSCDNLNGLQGAANFVRILANEDFWKKQDVSLKVYSNSHTFSNALEYQHSLKYKIKLELKRLLKLSDYGKRLKFYNHDLRVLGAKPVECIQSDVAQQDWVLLNDLYVADRFYMRYGNEKNTIFMMHNNGNFLSMLEYLLTDKKIRKYLNQLEEKIYRYATKIVFVSKKAKSDFDTAHPQYKDKTVHIYIGLEDVDRTEPDEKSDEILRLVTVGSVNKRKNQIAIIKAMNEIGDKNIRLCIVGAGEELDRCRKFAKEHDLERQILFAGAQTDVQPFLDKADVFILASKDEGLPIAGQEALREGLPIIVTNVGGCKELIEGNGIMLNEDGDGLINAILYCKQHRSDLKEWGAKSRRIYEKRFTVKSMLDHYNKMINR